MDATEGGVSLRGKVGLPDSVPTVPQSLVWRCLGRPPLVSAGRGADHGEKFYRMKAEMQAVSLRLQVCP